MDYKESFVLYESIYKQFERLYKRGKAEAASEYINAVMRYGLYKEEPEEESEVWLYGFDSFIATANSSKRRYEQTKADGAKGGRKRLEIDMTVVWDLLEKGYSYQQIADTVGCSKNTIANRVQETKNQKLNCTETTKNQQQPETNKNLNVNVNLNENFNGDGNGETLSATKEPFIF